MSRRVHPLTPMLRGGAHLFAVILLATNAMTNASWGIFANLVSANGYDILKALGVVVVALVVCFMVSLLWWRAMSYTVTDKEVEFRHGLFAKKVRTARLDRAQAIDVVHPFIPRLFGLAAVRIETAGGNQSRIDIGFLTTAQAARLREEILYGTRDDNPGDVVVPPIPLRRGVAAALLTYSGLTAAASVLATAGFEFNRAAFVPLLLATGLKVWKFVDGAYQFTAQRSEGKILVSYGLANLQRKTLRINRVHAVRMHQPPLWRMLGWWRVTVSVAGYGEGKAGMTVLPVGDKRTAVALVELLIGVEVDPRDPASVGVPSPPRARWVSPMDWAQQRLVLTPDYAVEYRGRVGASCAVAFRRHIQSASVHIGPFDRLLRLSSVRLHLVQGPVSVTARNVDLADAWALLRQV